MARTNIAVDEATADSLADEATKENKSLYALTNEALAAVLRVCEYGGTPREVYPSWRFSRILKDTDAIPLPGDLMEELTKKIYSTDKDWLLSQWFGEGKRIGSYLRMYAEDFKELVSRVDEVQAFLPVKRVEFERKEEQEKINITVRVIGAGLSHESTSCSEQFLRGILSAYPYKIVSSRISEGMIEVRAEEEKPHKP
ncbi:MAG: hypothetical protein OK422_02330 [Thaumarchaeota archaeon]|nr:hypothetical protein [Nitrososphaerota archaeon]